MKKIHFLKFTWICWTADVPYIVRRLSILYNGIASVLIRLKDLLKTLYYIYYGNKKSLTYIYCNLHYHFHLLPLSTLKRYHPEDSNENIY